MKYYRVKVKLKTGFEYSYTCIQRMLEGMKKSSEGYWTESVVSEEITEEDFRKTREVSFEKEPKVREEPKIKNRKKEFDLVELFLLTPSMGHPIPHGSQSKVVQLTTDCKP